jgi:Fe-S-cluster-containing hydrogenase component 2
MCVISCPLGAIEVDPVKHTAFKCDLCGGDPECEKICLAEALTYVDKAKVGFTGRREALKKLSDRLVLVAGMPTEEATE